jgi:hypothetical protein
MVTAILVPVFMLAVVALLLLATLFWDPDHPGPSPSDPGPHIVRTIDGTVTTPAPEDLDR